MVELIRVCRLKHQTKKGIKFNRNIVSCIQYVEVEPASGSALTSSEIVHILQMSINTDAEQYHLMSFDG